MCYEIRIIWHLSVWLISAFIVRTQAEKESRGGVYNMYWAPGKCQETDHVLCMWNLAFSAQFSLVVTMVLWSSFSNKNLRESKEHGQLHPGSMGI